MIVLCAIIHRFGVKYEGSDIMNTDLIIARNMRKLYGDELSDQELYKEFMALSEGFRELVAVGFYRGNLDKKVLKKIVTPSEYREWMEVAKEWSEKRERNGQL
jgi:hypothetical protein